MCRRGKTEKSFPFDGRMCCCCCCLNIFYFTLHCFLICEKGKRRSCSRQAAINTRELGVFGEIERERESWSCELSLSLAKEQKLLCWKIIDCSTLSFCIMDCLEKKVKKRFLCCLVQSTLMWWWWWYKFLIERFITGVLSFCLALSSSLSLTLIAANIFWVSFLVLRLDFFFFIFIN